MRMFLSDFPINLFIFQSISFSFYALSYKVQTKLVQEVEVFSKLLKKRDCSAFRW